MSHPERPGIRRPVRRLLASAAAVLVTAAALLLPAGVATAAELPGGSTSPTTGGHTSVYGANDLALDFGFVTLESPTPPRPEEPASGDAELASTGGLVAWPALVAAGAAALLGVVLIATGRRPARR